LNEALKIVPYIEPICKFSAIKETNPRLPRKSDKRQTIAPWIFAGAAAAPHIQKLFG
jgi:hypothetical protein